MPKIDFLLTGHSGFFGNEIKKNLSPQYSIVTIGRDSSSNYVCDLSIDIPSLQELEVTTVIHAAGKAHMIPSNVQEEKDFHNVNYQGTVNLTIALERLKRLPENFVFISTVAVYGLDEGELIDEDFPLQGVTPYAKSKILSEKYLAQWCQAHHVRLTILRLPLLV